MPSVSDQVLRLRFTLTASSVERPDSFVVTAVHASGGDIRAFRVIVMTARIALKLRGPANYATPFPVVPADAFRGKPLITDIIGEGRRPTAQGLGPAELSAFRKPDGSGH